MKRRLGLTGVSAGLRSWLNLWARVSMLALVPMLTNFLSNRYQVSVQDLLVPVIVDLAAAAIVTGVFYRRWRRDPLAGLIGAGLTVLVLASGYDNRLSAVLPLIQALTPAASLGGLEGPLFSLAFVVFIAVAGGWAGRGVSAWVQARKWSARDATVALTIGIAATFLFQCLTVARDVAAEWPQFFYKPPQVQATLSAAGSKPDIYYIVLDRYASQDVLKQQFQFDNADFIKYLEDNQYYVNPSAHNNYPYTTMSIASTMQADYLSTIVTTLGKASAQTLVPFNETVRNSPVAQQLQKLGYSYDVLGNWYETSNLSEAGNNDLERTGILTVLGHRFVLNNFSKLVLTQSIFGRLVSIGLPLGHSWVIHYDNMGDVDLVRYQLDTLRQLASAPAGGRFIYAHILVPHDPYYFNADGSLAANTDTDNVGKPVKQKYLGQVQYINTQMKAILSQINSASEGKSVVVLQADEGPYPSQLNDEIFNLAAVDGEVQGGDMRAWPDVDLQMKFGNLAAYHIPAADAAAKAEAADSVNVFRLIFNSYFGGAMPYLPDCYYAYPNGRDRPLNFASITTRLTGAPEDARCGADGSVRE